MSQPKTITDIQHNRMIELVEEEGKIYQGIQKASEEFGISFYMLRNIWYRKGLTQELSQKFFSNNPRMKVYQEKVEEVATEPTQIVIDLLNEYNPIAEAKSIIETIMSDYERTKRQVIHLEEENLRLTALSAKLESKLMEAQSISSSVIQDYQELLSVINKARVAHVNESIDLRDFSRSNSLRMERNGNLVTT